MTKPSEHQSAQVADDIRDAASEISNVLESIFDCIQHVGNQMVVIHRELVERHEPFTPEQLARLRPSILEQLKRHPFIDGLGVLTASDLVVDRARCVEWWRQDVNNVVPLWLNFDPNSVDIYDYLEMEWFVRAQRDNARSVFGPYVDYSGADHYILTLTAPVVDGVFLGAVGADIRMSLFEAKVLPALYGIDREVVLVNGERRVVSTNSPRWTVGSRLPTVPVVTAEGFVSVTPVGSDSGWVLAALGSAPN